MCEAKLILLNLTKKIDIKLPDSLRELVIKNYEYYLELPNNLISLWIGWIELYELPKNIIKLGLPYFNKEIKNEILPSKLKILNLASFNHKIPPNWLPQTLLKLTLPYKYNHVFEKYSLPKNIYGFKLGNKYDKLVNNLPENLKELNYDCSELNLENIPKNLKFIKIGNNVNNITYNNNKLPSTIKNMHFETYNIDKYMDIIPDYLNTLVLFLLSTYNNNVISVLPNNIKTLVLYSYYNPNNDFYPKNLHKLCESGLAQFFEEKLILCNNNINIDDVSLENLKILVLRKKYTNKIKKLPQNLIQIRVDKDYPHILHLNKITKAMIFVDDMYE